MANAESCETSKVRRSGAIAIIARPPFLFSAREPIDFDRLETLAIRRSMTVAAPGALCFPGGGVELGETPAAAARRECREEVGLDVRIVAYLTQNATPSGAPLYWFSAETVDPDFDETAIRLQTDEVSDYEWRSLPSLLADPDFLPNNAEIVRRIFAGEIPLL